MYRGWEVPWDYKIMPYGLLNREHLCIPCRWLNLFIFKLSFIAFCFWRQTAAFKLSQAQVGELLEQPLNDKLYTLRIVFLLSEVRTENSSKLQNTFMYVV